MRLFDLRSLCFLALITFSGSLSLSAQCPASLGCNDNVQVSLSFFCDAVLSPDLLLEDHNANCLTQVRIYNEFDVLDKITDTSTTPFTYPTVDLSYIGKRWKGEVFYRDDSGTEISCWGYFTVEDKIKPSVTCLDDFTVSCKEDLSELFTSTSTATYCAQLGDLDTDPNTETFKLTSGTTTLKPWEILTGLTANLVVPCGDPGTGSGGGTGSGTGSGTGPGGGAVFFTGFDLGDHIAIDCDANGNYDFNTIAGVAATGLTTGCPTITLPTGSFPPSELCFTVTAQSFGSYNPDNCDPNAEVVILSDVVDENECGNEGFVALRRIKYLVRDGQGATSTECSVDINFSAEPLSEIEFPADFKLQDSIDFCLTIDSIGPDVTGRPTLNGCVLEEGNLCKLNVSFEDTRLDDGTCNSNFIVRRKWVILDWCLGEYRQFFQTITVIDSKAPICSASPDFPVEATNGCSTDYLVTPFVSGSETFLNVLSDCSAVSIVRVEYTQTRDAFAFDDDLGPIFIATPLDDDTYLLDDLGVGQHWVRYILVDECGNSNEDDGTQCFFEITVQDSNPPIAVCDQFTAVSLADNGWGRLYPLSLDDGSYAPCGGDLTLEVRRSSNPCDTTLLDRDDTIYGPYVQFCCEEAGQTIPVMLQVTDAGGQTNACTVNVVVQDKNNDAVVVCPTPSTIIINDCDMEDPTDMFGTPTLSGQCAAPEIIDVINTSSMNDDCGVGSFTRSWVIAVNGNTGAAPNCSQTISVTGNDGFTQNSFVFPADVTLTDCVDFTTDLGLFPTFNGVKVTEANVCARLAFSFKDNSFFNQEDYCVKTIRTWTVINWCIYDPQTNPGEGIWSDTQIIKVRNTAAPTISGCVQDTTVILVADLDDCDAFANIPVPSAVDACFGNDLPAGDFNWTVNGPGTDTSGSGSTASQVLGVGTYTVTWSIIGGCNTTATCSYSIRVDDNGGPTAYCRSQVTTVITGPTPGGLPSVEIWASDFDLGSTDACGGVLSVSFDSLDITDTRKVFDCTQIGNHTVTVYFTDSDGNQDFCVTTATIQVNGNFCDTIGSITVIDIEGDIYTEKNHMIDNVNVELMNAANNSMGTYNTVDGHFAFNDITAYGNYTLQATGDNDYLNGISTLDLIMIQRHILGIEYLDSPYKIIAADVNSSESINGIDLVELRKLILGIYTQLPQSDNWRFVEEDFVFVTPQSPWPFVEDISLLQVNQDMMDNDFIAVKIGDVDVSAIVSLEDDEVENRNAGEVKVLHDLLSIGENEYLVPVYLDEEISLYGLQLAIRLNEGMDMDLFEVGKLAVSDNQIRYDEGVLRIAFSSEDLLTVKPGEALFHMTVSSENTITEAFTIDAGLMKSELYNEDFQVVNLEAGNMMNDNQIILHQNVPNPFNGTTRIRLDLPTADEVTFSVLNLAGQIISTESKFYEAGENFIILNSEDFEENGVYYYKVEAGNYSTTRKMIKVD